MEKKKVVVLQKRIKDYRVHLFDGVGELYETTIVGYLDPLIKGDNYSTLKLKHKYWPISLDYIFDKELHTLLKDADVVIKSTDFRSINNVLLRKAAPKAKIIMYGIGVSASYNEHYDELDESKQYLKMIEKSDAVIFYYDYPKNKYVKQGANPDKLFAANNTVYVPEFDLNRNPENIFFIGELYAQKGVVHLIERSELPANIRDHEGSIWMLCQQLTYRMEKEGVEGCANAIVNMFGTNAERAKDLAYRLYTIAERKKWAQEAYAYNALVVAWPEIQSRAAELKAIQPEQLTIFDVFPN